MTAIMPWRIQMFGSLRAFRTDLYVERFRRGTEAELLADLAFHVTRSHPREEIVECYWPEANPEAGRLNLRVALSSLRRRLEPPGTPRGSVLLADRTIVRLNSAMILTDVAEFETAVLAGRSDPVRNVHRLEEAVCLYTGELLPGYRAEWIGSERERLGQMYLETLGILAQTLRERGELDAALSYALQMVATDRQHEPAHLLLMRLYAEAGRLPSALNQYATLRRWLRRDFNASPSSEARQLARSLRTYSRSVVIPISVTAPAFSSTAPVSSAGSTCYSDCLSADEPVILPDSIFPDSILPNADLLDANVVTLNASGVVERSVGRARGSASHLPQPTTCFFGREEERALVAALLTDRGYRLVTLAGPGGCGKTRLALELASHLYGNPADAVWFVPLADIDDAGLIPQAILTVLGVGMNMAEEPLWQVASALSQLQTKPSAPVAEPTVLLVLDNFEQLVEGGGSFILSLLERLPGLSCLVTSRRHLGVPGERVVDVPPLSLPETADTLERLAQRSSVRLFVDRAQAKSPEFQVTERNRQAVFELVWGLEGIPLALEMAAVWIRVYTPARMVTELASRYRLLGRNIRGVPDRHKTLQDAVAWSFDLLSPQAKSFLTNLSVFRGGWTLEAAEAICCEPEAASLLSELSEHSWITSEEQITGEEQIKSEEQIRNDGEVTSDESDVMRFRMLKTLQEFAEQQLNAEERYELGCRHADHYACLFEEAKHHFDGPGQRLWVAWTAAEWDNLSAAVRWYLAQDTDPKRVLLLSSNLCRFCEIRGYPAAGRGFLEAALAKPGDVDPAVRGPALNSAGWLAFIQGDHAAAKPRFEEALSAAGDAANCEDEAIALGNLGLCHEAEGHYDEAASCFGRSGDLAREAGAGLYEANARGNLANLLKSRGNYEEACAQYRECVELFKELNNRRSEAIVWINMGEAFCKCGKFPEGREPYRRAMEISHQLQDRWLLTACFEGLADILAEEKHIGPRRLEPAVRLLGAAAHLRRQIGIPIALAEQEGFEQAMDRWRQELGVAAFQRFWQEGEGATLEQAIQWASK